MLPIYPGLLFRAMAPILKYGVHSSVRLDSSKTNLLGHHGMPNAKAIDDPAAAVVCALAEPLDYPPVAHVVTPGDRVVLALDEGTPRLAEIVAGVVASLIDGGVDPDGIGVLHAWDGATGGPNDPCRLLAEEVRSRVASIRHDPSDQDKLAYLAATAEGHQIELNRALIDADVVLPIGCFRDGSSAGYFGVCGAVYPNCSNAETLARFHSPKTLDSRGRRHKRLLKEADEVGWLLGANFAIQAIPGPGDGILDILAGEINAVRHQGLRRYSAAWRATVPCRAELVVAAIEGGEDQQTWANLGQALSVAATVVEEGGAVAVCCELAAARGQAIEWLAACRSRDEAIARIHEACPADAVPALQLAKALDHCSVYLLSRLDDAVVEDLEITPIGGVEEVVRLIARHGSYIALSNAPHAVVEVEVEDDDA